MQERRDEKSDVNHSTGDGKLFHKRMVSNGSIGGAPGGDISNSLITSFLTMNPNLVDETHYSKQTDPMLLQDLSRSFIS